MDLSKARVVTPKSGRTYTTVEVASESNPHIKYTVDLVNVRCSCPGWTKHAPVNGARRLCKHLRKLGFKD